MGINIIREKILLNGFATKTDIRKFLKCSTDRAYEVFNDIKSEIESEGKKTFTDRVFAKRLLKYIEITEEQIHEYANIEQKKATE